MPAHRATPSCPGLPDAAQFDWQVSDEFRPQPSGDEAEELRMAHVVNMAGSYCSAGDAITGKRKLVD